MQFRTPGSRRATTALANLVVATLAVAVPLALAEDVGAAGAASVSTLFLQPETSQLTDSTSERDQKALLSQGLHDIYEELRTGKFQPVIAVAALLLGLAAVFTGEHSFKMLLTISSFGLFYILAKANTKLAWHDGASGAVDWGANVVGVEVGLLAAVTTYTSYGGLKIVIGAILGFALGRMIESTLTAQFSTMHRGTEIVFYSLLVGIGVFVFWRGHHKHLLHVVMPILGGSFVVSALLYTIAVVTKPSVQWVWVSFFCPLWQPSGRHDIAGMLGKQGDNITLGCYVIWVTLIISGAAVQWCLWKKNRPAKKPKSSATVAGPGSGGKQLGKPLLQGSS